MLLLAQRTIERAWGPSDDTVYVELEVPEWRSEGLAAGALGRAAGLRPGVRRRPDARDLVRARRGRGMDRAPGLPATRRADRRDTRRASPAIPSDSAQHLVVRALDGGPRRAIPAEIAALYEADREVFYDLIATDPRYLAGWGGERAPRARTSTSVRRISAAGSGARRYVETGLWINHLVAAVDALRAARLHNLTLRKDVSLAPEERLARRGPRAHRRDREEVLMSVGSGPPAQPMLATLAAFAILGLGAFSAAAASDLSTPGDGMPVSGSPASTTASAVRKANGFAMVEPAPAALPLGTAFSGVELPFEAPVLEQRRGRLGPKEGRPSRAPRLQRRARAIVPALDDRARLGAGHGGQAESGRHLRAGRDRRVGVLHRVPGPGHAAARVLPAHRPLLAGIDLRGPRRGVPPHRRSLSSAATSTTCSWSPGRGQSLLRQPGTLSSVHRRALARRLRHLELGERESLLRYRSQRKDAQQARDCAPTPCSPWRSSIAW